MYHQLIICGGRCCKSPSSSLRMHSATSASCDTVPVIRADHRIRMVNAMAVDKHASDLLTGAVGTVTEIHAAGSGCGSTVCQLSTLLQPRQTHKVQQRDDCSSSRRARTCAPGHMHCARGACRNEQSHVPRYRRAVGPAATAASPVVQ